MSGKETRLRRSRSDEDGGEENKALLEGSAAPEREPTASAASEQERPAAEQRPAARARETAPRAASDEGLDFAAMLEQHGGFKPMDVRLGDRVTTRIIRIGKEDVFLDLGPGQDGVMSKGELLDEEGRLTVKEGDEIELFVIAVGATVVLSRRMGRGVDLIGLEQAFRSKMPVEGKVTGVNKGGLDVDVSGARAFCRMGAIDLHHVEDPSALVGQTLTFLITEMSEGGKNLVVSRRAVLESERKKAAGKLMEELKEGQVREGVVTRLTDFGAFVDLGGIDGLVPLSELSWGHVKSPDEVVSVGDKLSVEVRRIEDDPKRKGEKRVGLSLRTSDSDPWVAYANALVPEATLEGKVQKLEAFGAFVEVKPGVTGLVHVSELAPTRIRHPSDVVKVGDTVSVRVLEVDPERRRLSLSLREKVEPGALPSRGIQTVGTVTRVESYGVFVDLESGGSALLPASESLTPPGTDLRRALPIGTRLDVMVIDTDERGRVKVSQKAIERAEEEAALKEHKTSGDSGGGFGTFADLLKGKRG